MAASRLGNIGSLLGYGIGTLDLPGIWGSWLGNTQFKQLCVLAALILTGCCGITAWATAERVLISPKYALLFVGHRKLACAQLGDADMVLGLTRRVPVLSGSLSNSSRPPSIFQTEYRLFAGFNSGHG